VTGTQTQTAWALEIRDLAEMLETHLAEVKHKGEMKCWHPEPLAHGRLLHRTIHGLPIGPLGLGPTGPPGLHITGTPGCLHTSRHLPQEGSSTTRHGFQTCLGDEDKTGLEANGVTPELLRLKFYCSWTRMFLFFIYFIFSFLFFFLFFVCLVSCFIVHHLSLSISLVLHFF
jgi:hypothetical protein